MIKILNNECYQYHKETLETYSGMPDEMAVIRPTKQRLRDIERAMLEYRRANNIFEVRDLVVGRCYEDYDDSILTITEKFDHFGNPSVVFECEKTICDDFESELRHATDAEIAAGHRL